jgi:hypothetical protein
MPKLLLGIAIGALAGLAYAVSKNPLGLPGHKALLWIVPVLTARWVYGCWGSGIAGAVSTAAVAMAFGQDFAGSTLFLPLVVLAGAALDAAVSVARGWRLRWWAALPLAGLGGLIANLLCFVHRLLGPLHPKHSVLNIPGAKGFLLSYALFGLLSGLIGAALAGIILAARKRT